MQEFFWFICLFIWFLCGGLVWINTCSKKINKLKNVIKHQWNPVSNYFNDRLKSQERFYFDECEKLKNTISNLNSSILYYKNKLSEKYCQEEFINFNTKIKKQEKKIKEMYQIMPMYKDFYFFLNNQYKKKES